MSVQICVEKWNNHIDLMYHHYNLKFIFIPRNYHGQAHNQADCALAPCPNKVENTVADSEIVDGGLVE